MFIYTVEINTYLASLTSFHFTLTLTVSNANYVPGYSAEPSCGSFILQPLAARSPAKER